MIFSFACLELTPENNLFARTVDIPSAPAAKGTALMMSLLSCKERKIKGDEEVNKNHRHSGKIKKIDNARS